MEPTRHPDGSTESDDLALVLTGGGARSAYQAGFLRALFRRQPALEFPIITGVSAGAINAVFLAADPGDGVAASEALASFWANLTTDQVLRTDATFLGSNLLRWALRLVSGGSALAPEVRGLVDTTPLGDLLSRVLEAGPDGDIPGIQRNLEARRLRAVSLTTLDYASGRAVAWVQGCDIRDWERPSRGSSKTRLGIDHVMASSALPLFFPAIRLDGSWHGDGGMRLSTPLSPALHLGARRILAVSTRHRRDPDPSPVTMDRYPSPAHVMGTLFNSVFLDSIDEDAHRAKRLNRLVGLLPEGRHPEVQPVDLLVLRPSRDLGRMARDFEIRLPRAFRFLTRGLGTRETATPDFLSLLLFQPDYLQTLMEVGEEDAERHMDEIEALIEPQGPSSTKTPLPLEVIQRISA